MRANRALGRSHEGLGLAGRCLGTIQMDLNTLAFVLRVVRRQVTIKDVTHVAVDLFFDLAELLRAVIPLASLDRTLLASLWPDLWGARVSNDPGLPDRHAPVPGGCAPLRGAASYEAEG